MLTVPAVCVFLTKHREAAFLRADQTSPIYATFPKAGFWAHAASYHIPRTSSICWRVMQYSRIFTPTTLSSTITVDLTTLTRCEIGCRIAHATSSHGARLVVSDQIGRRPRSWCTSRSRTVDETAHNQSRLVRSVVASVAKWRLVSFSI